MVRFKNRYVTVQVIPQSNQKISAQELSREILNKVKDVYGEYGSAMVRTGFSTSYCNDTTNMAIIRVRHGQHKFITSTLPLITKINQNIAKVRIIHVGATLRHCYIGIVRNQTKKIDLFSKRAKIKEEVEMKSDE